MRKKVILWIPALILLMSATSVNAQVIIGGDGIKDPHAGAGLDLSPLGTDNLGLLLPRVELTDDAEEFALVTEATPQQKTDARGMLVYNADNDILDGKGLYIWDGAKWKAVALAPPPPVEDYSTVIDADENTYSAAKFGDAGWWMTENLRSKSYIDANTEERKPIPIKNNNTNTNSPYYHYPGGVYTSTNAPEGYKDEYGLLYTWAAATGRTGILDNEENKSDQDQHQGICPSGWHLPSDYEWNQLEQVIAESDAGVYSTTGAITWNVSATSIGYRSTHAPKMKSETPVNSYATNGTSNSRTANGFDALLVGNMYSGSASGYGTYTVFWSSSSGSSSYAWYRYLYYSDTGVDRNNDNKYLMYSVRCKKNDN
jgi:uncharacterized protein (TIGR02145 family)